MYEVTGRVGATTAKTLDEGDDEAVIVYDPNADEYLVTRPKSNGGGDS